MKNATGVFLDGMLYLGGGYTGSSKTDPIVHVYNLTSCKWSQLPPCPLKWSTVRVFGEKLVLVGGRVTRGATKLAIYTNKVAVWNASAEQWDFSFPCMLAPRMSPIVVHVDNHLIAAGGNKGSLDYQAEVLHEKVGKWVCGPSLPLRCLSNTSAIVGEEWYLADMSNGIIRYANIREYIRAASRQFISEDAQALPSSGSLWQRITSNPPDIPFRIASVNSQLMALSDPQQVGVTAHVYQQDVWAKITGKLPYTFGSGLLLDSDSEENVFYVLGGEMGQQYSNQAHKLDFMTCKGLKVIKKSRQTRMSE